MIRPHRLLASLLAVALVAGSSSAQVGAKTSKPTLGTIERTNPRINALIPPEAQIERLAEGFDWSEGPVWVAKEKALLFSDVPQNVVYKWAEGMSKAEVYLKPSGYTGSVPRGGEPGSNGLTLDPSGQLVLCQHGDRRVARLGPDRSFVTVVEKFEGKRFNSPNDAVYGSDGSLYFTDPPYGLLGLNKDPKKELPFNGVYRLSPDGKLTLLTKEMTFPNGIGLSPDEKTLYVANSDPEKALWMAFPLKPDGTVGPGRVFFDATRGVKTLKGLPDGLKVDKDGNLFATGPGGVLIFAPDGTLLGTLNTGEATGNVAFGDDGSILYIAADMYLARVKTTTKGRGF